MTPSEPALHRELRQGPDGARIRDRIRTHQAEVWRYLRYLGAGPDEAEDLCQEVFLAWLGGEGRVIDEPGRLAAYLRGIARHLFLAHLRRLGRMPAVAFLDPDGLARTEESWRAFRGDDGGERWLEALRTCVELLEERDRRVVEGRYAEGSSRLELGHELGLSPDGVKTLLRRLRARLRACVERRLVA